MKRTVRLTRPDGSTVVRDVEYDDIEPSWLAGMQQQLADVQQQLGALQQASVVKEANSATAVEWSVDFWKSMQPPRRRSDPNWKSRDAGIWSFRGR